MLVHNLTKSGRNQWTISRDLILDLHPQGCQCFSGWKYRGWHFGNQRGSIIMTRDSVTIFSHPQQKNNRLPPLVIDFIVADQSIEPSACAPPPPHTHINMEVVVLLGRIACVCVSQKSGPTLHISINMAYTVPGAHPPLLCPPPPPPAPHFVPQNSLFWPKTASKFIRNGQTKGNGGYTPRSLCQTAPKPRTGGILVWKQSFFRPVEPRGPTVGPHYAQPGLPCGSNHWYGALGVSLGDSEAWKPIKSGGLRLDYVPSEFGFESCS